MDNSRFASDSTHINGSRLEQPKLVVPMEDFKGFLDKMKTVDSTQSKSDVLPDVQFKSPEEGQLDDLSKNFKSSLKDGMSPEEVAQQFADYMKENGSDMYSLGESVNPKDPLKEVANSLTEAMNGTGYTFESDLRGSQIVLHYGDQTAGVDCGPSLEDALGIPKEFQSNPRKN